MNSHNILVIGNGFDLYHNLKTQYIDFVNYTRTIKKPDSTRRIRGICQENIFIRCFQKIAKENQHWIDCEKEIESIVFLIKKIINDRKVFSYSVDHYMILRDSTSLYSEEFEKLMLMNKLIKRCNGARILLNDELFTQYNWINKEKVMNILKKELEDLIFVFRYYLENSVMNQNIEKLSDQIIKIDPEYILNFNYTHTYEKYGIKRDDVCYIHGSVQDNNMVLGIRDIDEKDIDSIHFKKFFQRIHKHTDVIQWDRFGEYLSFSKTMSEATTYFFGHSLSKTDGDIIRSIYENSRNIIIFHLNGLKDYEEKVINLIDTLGKENVVQGLYSGRIEFIPIK